MSMLMKFLQLVGEFKMSESHMRSLFFLPLEDISTEILILHDLCEFLSHILPVNGEPPILPLGRLKGDILKELLENRMESPGTDILCLFIDGCSYVRDLLNRIFSELYRNLLCCQEGDILFRECIVRFFQDAHEVMH